MKKILAIVLGVALLLSLIPGVAMTAGNLEGEGKLSGAHYNLNIIGAPYDKNDNFGGGNGARIFVDRTGTTQFYVYGNATTPYAVLDHDGTDGKVGGGVGDPGITFPYNEATARWQVEIYVRLLGPMDPDNIVHWKTYYDYNGTAWLQVKTFDITRGKPSKFSLRTGDLLIDGYQDILWEMTPGDKFRILQMRIYLHPEY